MIMDAQYERYCQAMDKEDGLIDQRVNWLLVSQSILFAALGISSQEIVEVTIVVIPIVGMGASLLIGVSILAAFLSFLRYRRILLEECPRTTDSKRRYPQLHRRPANIALGLTSPILLPVLFCGAWILVQKLTIDDCTRILQ